ncbi:MAG: ABC transporter permease [Microbacteriaceae bacterium]|nr:ABC transporter permease [Microbacteriaceae bacterium]
MSSATATQTRGTTSPGISSKAFLNASTGFGIMVRFILRRNWLRMLIWLVVLAGMIVLVIQSQAELFPTQADRDAYAHIANTPAVAALTGLPYAASTLGGILNIKIWMTIAVALSFAVIFMVTRNGRAEEEAGRTELLRAGVLGHHAYSLANWTVFSGFAMLVGLATAGAAMSQGLPTDGALVMGASFAATAIVFVGISAVAGQLTRTGGGANALASVVLGVSFLVRAIADVQSDGEHATWLTWLSPIGWAQQSRSYDTNNWWPLLLCLGAAAILFWIALALQRNRDLGAGMIPERVGPRTASAVLRTQLGLTFRLQRGSLIGWSVGVIVFAVFYGGISTAVADLLTGSDPISQLMFGGSANILDGLFGMFVMMNAVLVAAFVLNSADSIRAAESAGRVEMQWSSAISRIRWAASRMAVPAVWSLVLLAASGVALGITFEASTGTSGQVGRFFLASIAYWPTSLLVIGIVVLCAAVIPRAASAVTWGLYGVVAILSMFGELFGLPDWVINNTPFTAIPRLDTDFTLLPLIVITAIAVIAGGVGLWVLRNRDMTGA